VIRTEIDEEQLRKRFAEHGYTLEKVVHFKKYDRIVFGTKDFKLSINMRGLLSEYALDAIVEACIGKPVECAQKVEGAKK
jgi:hypothetical protein